MAEARKILGQAALAATTSTDVYTVPSLTEVVVSTITVCNRGATDATFRLSVAPDGEAVDNKHYLYYDAVLPGNETFAATIGITLDAADKIRAYASTGNVSVNVFGVELT